MFKWINVFVAFFTVPANLWAYAAYGDPINLIAAVVCFVLAASAFLACVAIENSFRR